MNRSARGGGITTISKIASKTYDVVIVGAGISGVLTAHALVCHGLKVLVDDRRRSVIASTAMIQHEIDVPRTSKLGWIEPGPTHMTVVGRSCRTACLDDRRSSC